MSKLVSWDKMMDTAMSLPVVKVSRDSFLSEAFSGYGNTQELANKRPIDVFGIEIVEKVAKAQIKSQLMKTTGLSALAGLPGGLAIAGTIPADLAQYYGNALALSQKLAYIYGYPDLLENGKVTEETRALITLFVGAMLGAQAANKTLSEVSKKIALEVARRLPRQALTKTGYYPIVKQVAKWIGVEITKPLFAKYTSKLIPVLGGVVSGGITYATFRTMAFRLKNQLHSDMVNLDLNAHYFQNDAEEVEEAVIVEEVALPNVEADFESLKIQACINIAKIDFELHQEEIDFIVNLIEEASLPDERKAGLLNDLHSKDIIEIDFSAVKGNDLYSLSLIENIIELVNVDGIIKPVEKIYLFKVANELGFSREDVMDMLKHYNEEL